ncbi:MAG: aldo/keto reductase [Chloroflexi bacterium]|nr:aldo/keto reductase [Chloroflexota bacterium]
MEKRVIGQTGIEVSAISLGCWPMGGDYWGGADDEESIRTIHKALELGINFLDTAPAYGRGHSEEVVGRALAGRRHEAVISTKASGAGHAEEDLRKKLAGSLERLQTDYVDVYFIHWPSREEPLAPTMEALEKLRAEGLIRAIGVSNFDVSMLEMASRHGRVDILQPPYNLIWRFIEEDVLPYCVEHGIGISTYSSLAQGLLTGTIRLNTRYAPGDMRPRSVLWKSENLGKCLYTVERLRAVAKELGVTLAQLSLRWLVSQPGVTTALVGARTVAEISENAGTFGWEMPEQAMRQVQEISDELYRSFPYYYDMWENWMTWQKRGPQREF